MDLVAVVPDAATLGGAGCTGNVCLLRRVAPAGNAGCENGNIHKYKIVIAMVCFSRYVLDCLDWNCVA